MKKFKILFTDHTPLVGGAQLALLRHLRCLDGAKFQPLVACSLETASLVDKFRSTGVKVYPVSFARLKSFSLLSLLRFSKAAVEVYKIIVRENVDLVVSNTERTSYPSLLSAKILQRKFVLWVRDYEYRRFLFLILSNFADEIVFVSQALKNYYKSRKGRVVYVGTDIAHRCHSRENGNPDYIDSGSVAGMTQRESEVGMIRIGFAGRLVEWKGAQVLIEAGKILKEDGFLPNGWKIIVAGNGVGQEGSNEEELHQSVEKCNMENEVQFIGFKENLSEFYRSLSVFVHPSIKDEPFATVIVEAMAYGLPVIASNVGGTPEIVSDGVNGFLFPPGDARNLADQLKKLVADRMLREKIGNQARQTVLSGFTEEKVTKKLEEVYLDILRFDGNEAMKQ